MKISIAIISLILFLSSCSDNKTEQFQKVELGINCLNNLNLSYFQGIFPSIEINKVYEILGEPDERFVVNDDIEPRTDLAYYNQQGRILLHWSGDIIDEVGMVEYRPKGELLLKDVFPQNINLQKNILRLDCNEKYKIYIYLNDNLKTIKNIEWWFQ